MIDTIRLTIDEGHFNIWKPEDFKPHADSILKKEKNAKQSGISKCVLNPTKFDKESGIYYPRLTLRRRPPNITELVIEFSIPKLLFSNNFEELSEDNFEMVIETLSNRLMEKEVYIFKKTLENASVSAIHYGKNFILPRYTLCSSIIRKLSKAHCSGWYDHNMTEFRNGGTMFKLHSNSFELAFYDKVKDLENSKRGKSRSHEVDNEIQYNLFENADVSLDFQVLRMEIRLNTRTKIRQDINRLENPIDDLRFFALFKKQIAQGLLRHYWKPYYKALPHIIRAEHDQPTELLDCLIEQDPDASMSTQLQRLGAMALVGQIGWPGLRVYCDGRESAYNRLKKAILNLPEVTGSRFKDFEKIQSDLMAFEPVKIENYKNNTQVRALLPEGRI